MPTLLSLLKEYPNDWVLNNYLNCSKEHWCKDSYYIGGQLKMGLNDEINWKHLADVSAKQSQPRDVANQWEMASIERSSRDFIHFLEIYTDYCRKKTINGLLRAIVFWLAPARKRATEKVFHPDNLVIEREKDGTMILKIKKK